MYKTRYHRDGSVTLWHVYSQTWVRTATVSDQTLATLGQEDRERILRHIRGVSHYEILWCGAPERTMAAAYGTIRRAPRGGRHVRSRESADDMLARYLACCEQHAGTIEAAHSPRVVAVLRDAL